MTFYRLLREEIARIGYSAIERDYVFSDVFAAAPVDRQAALAAFTHTPPSYRNAALAVVEAKGRNPTEIATQYRALGAPLLFLINGQDVTVWQVKSGGEPRAIARAKFDELRALFAEHGPVWGPEPIHRACLLYTSPSPRDRS